MPAISLWRSLAWLCALLFTMLPGRAQVTTTTVQDTVYHADGTTATGTILVTWPAFVTASGKTVAAGNITATIGSGGQVSLNLAPNVGATPAGSYYTAVYHLDDGTVSKEYWSVPNCSFDDGRGDTEPSDASECSRCKRSRQPKLIHCLEAIYR